MDLAEFELHEVECGLVEPFEMRSKLAGHVGVKHVHFRHWRLRNIPEDLHEWKQSTVVQPSPVLKSV